MLTQELRTETMKLKDGKVETSAFQAELRNKSNKADLELKVNIQDFQIFSQQLQTIIDDLIDKLFTLVSPALEPC